MKHCICLLFILSPLLLFSQYSIHLSESVSTPDLAVSVGRDLSFADLSIEISERVYDEDFSIGMTTSMDKADVIISNSSDSSEVSIQIRNEKETDLTINVYDIALEEDFRIKIKSADEADYLVFSEVDSLNNEHIAVALLPIINAHLRYTLEDVPYWAKGGLLPSLTVVQPAVYCCPGRRRFIRSVDAQKLALSDGSEWFISPSGTYLSSQWNIFDEVVVLRTNSVGQYVLSRRPSQWSGTRQRVGAFFMGRGAD